MDLKNKKQKEAAKYVDEQVKLIMKANKTVNVHSSAFYVQNRSAATGLKCTTRTKSKQTGKKDQRVHADHQKHECPILFLRTPQML